MSETHVNAFYMNVDEKKKTVEQAKAELAEAERLLKAHPDFEEPKEDEPQVESKEDEPQVESKEDEPQVESKEDEPQVESKEDSKPEAKETKTKTAK